jgi:hypothetical protein
MIVSLDSVRHFMLDRSEADNFLLDDVEFGEDTLAEAMVFVVDTYNSMLPHVDTYSVECFPFRAEAIKGVAAYCLRAMAINLTRNVAESRAEGGTTLDDKRGKAQAYLAVAQRLQDEAEISFKAIKVSKNVESSYRSFW